MMKPLNNKDSAFLLEEVFQLLRESLAHDPFKQGEHQPTKRHITRFRNLLGSEFSFLLAETGNLFYSVLHTAEAHVAQEFNVQNPYAVEAKKIYAQLLLTSQLIMCAGIESEQTIDAFIVLDQFSGRKTETMHDVIDNTLEMLQKNMCTLACS